MLTSQRYVSNVNFLAPNSNHLVGPEGLAARRSLRFATCRLATLLAMSTGHRLAAWFKSNKLNTKNPPNLYEISRTFYGGGGANLLEPEPITSKVGIVVSWKKEQVDTVRLAKLRWVDKWSYEQIAAEFGIGRTKVIAELRRVKSVAQSRKAK